MDLDGDVLRMVSHQVWWSWCGDDRLARVKRNKAAKSTLCYFFLGDFLKTVAKTNMDKEGKILTLKESINRELANAIIIVNRLTKLDEFMTLL